MAVCREVCDRIWKFRLANTGKIPLRNSDDPEESRLAQALAKLRMRAHGDIGAGTYPSMKQLTSDDADYLRNTLDKPCEASVSDPSDHAASKVREQCDQIWAFRLAHGGAIPRQRSDDAEEAKLGRCLCRLRMRELYDIAQGTNPGDKQAFALRSWISL